MNELKIFENEQFGAVRVIEQSGEPWFVLKDVCESFGEANYRRVSARLDDDEKGVSQIATPGGNQNMTVVNEPGLYSALFSMQPEKARGVSDEYVERRVKQLKAFKRWITHDVIPAIRKTGGYIHGADNMGPEELMEKALVVAQKTLADREARISSLTVNLEIARPKAEYFDELVERNTLTNFRETAKEIGAPPKAFVRFLLDKKYVYRGQKGKLLPYESKNDGLFEVKECFNDKTQWSGTQTLVTPKGRETFRLLFV